MADLFLLRLTKNKLNENIPDQKINCEVHFRFFNKNFLRL
jgi:hypothetical protein